MSTSLTFMIEMRVRVEHAIKLEIRGEREKKNCMCVCVKE